MPTRSAPPVKRASRATVPATDPPTDPPAALRAICLAVPDAIEKQSHGEPAWFTGAKGKVFAMYDNHHHGAAHISVWVAAPMELQEALVEAEPHRYWRPPYVGHRGWVAIILDTEPEWAAVTKLVREAFAMVATGRRPRPPARR